MSDSNNITIQFVTSPGCVHCSAARKIFEELKPKYPQMQIEEIDVTTSKGMELITKYSIFASPGIIVNNELFATGGLNKDTFIKKLDSLKN